MFRWKEWTFIFLLVALAVFHVSGNEQQDDDFREFDRDPDENDDESEVEVNMDPGLDEPVLNGKSFSL